MKPRFFFLAILATVLLGDSLPAQDGPAKLAPTTVTIRADNLPVAKILADLSKQSGMEVVDGRTAGTEKPLTIQLQKATFWEAVDAVARAAGAEVSLYAAEGKVVLVDRAAEPVPVSPGGAFRTTVKRLDVSKDLVTGHRQCRIGLEVDWEPRLEPLYLEVAQWSVKFGPDGGNKVLEEKKKGTGRMAVFGRAAREIELIGEAPDRSVQGIRSLQGELRIITPEKMWNASFE